MPSRCVRDAVRRRLRPGGGEDSLRAARVGEARVALDQAVGHEPVDEAGDPALAEEHAVGELAHPDAGGRGASAIGEEGVVLGERQVVLGPKLLVERDARCRACARRNARHGSRRGSRGGEGSDARLGDGHGADATPCSSLR